MTDNTEFPEFEGLRFFGKMNASISHELRNCLAVINENAGLVKDLIQFSEKGHPLDLNKIGSRLDKVLEHVRKTDSIIDNMNRFAHSVDDPFTRINVCDYLKFVIRLSERFAAMKGVTLDTELSDKTIEITTYPFLFENLLYACIEKAMENPSEDKTITVSVEKADGRIQICFRGIKSGLENSEDIPDATLEKLGAKIIDDNKSESFILDVPEKN